MIYQPINMQEFMKKAQYWASSFPTICIYNSNGFEDPYSAFSMTIAIGHRNSLSFTSDGSRTLEKLQAFIDQHQGEFIAGYLGYDLKNEMEEFSVSSGYSSANLPNAFFFTPEIRLTFKGDQVEIHSATEDADRIVEAILNFEPQASAPNSLGEIKAKMSREEYGIAFKNVQDHILKGNIYEVNLCQEFFAEEVTISPFETYERLNLLSPTPFSCFFKHGNHAIISASPERFLARRGNSLISQPIKGTAARGKTVQEDEENKERLRNNPKDISENIMIVDLVRNDLTRSAEKGSVKVDELLGLYSFPQVHQLISTVSCKQADNIKFSAIMGNTFPAGSMTGAPKISAMQISDATEKSARNIYSGSVGYISPTNDFDFNVIIRSIIYDSTAGSLSYHVGGAITALSNEEDEYQECILKAEAIIQLLNKLKKES